MKNIVYFDLETQKSADEVGGWDKISRMGMSVGVTYSTARGDYRIYGEPQVNDLVTELQRADLSAPGREVVQAIAEIPPGAAAGRHTHPGEEVGYVLEGTVLVEVDGKPAATLKAGQYFIIPAGTIHNATNNSKAGAKVLATYIVEKGKPVATPVK